MSFQEWVAAVKAQGGVAVVWPFSAGPYADYLGFPAARYDGQAYTAAFNSGQINSTAPQQSTTDGKWIYVLAPQTVAASAPSTMTTWQRVQNATLATADKVAKAAGLPTLAGLEHFIIGGLVLVAAVVAVVGLHQVRGLVHDVKG